MVSDIIKALIYDINNHPQIGGIFNDVTFGVKNELSYPALLINIADFTNKGWYGYSDLLLFFSIIDNRTKIDAIELFDTLIEHLNRFSGGTDPTTTIKYEIVYSGGYDDVYDPDSREYIITSLWRLQSIQI